MNKIDFHPARLIRIDGGEWKKLPRTEFQLLRILHCVQEKTLPFGRIHRLLWGIPDEPCESFMVRLTRKRLLTQLYDASPELPWEEIIRVHRNVGYGLYLRGGRLVAPFPNRCFPDRITPDEEMRRIAVRSAM